MSWSTEFSDSSYQSEGQEGTGSERTRRLCEGRKPWRGNPMSVTGMKQGREVLEEGSRQEGGKPWRRKVVGEANPREPGFQG